MRAPIALFALFLCDGSSACNVGAVATTRVHTPPIVVDLDSERARLEQRLCEAPDALGCQVLGALDASDGEVSDPPAFPALLPRTVDVEGRAVDVAAWLEEQRKVHDIVPALTVPVTLPSSPFVDEALGDAVIEDARLVFDDDTLDVDLPQFVLAANGKKVGVVAAHAGGSGEDAPISLVEGGADALLAAVKAGHAALSATPPADAPIPLRAGPGDTLVSPGGAASVSLDVILDVQITADLGVNAQLEAAGS